MIILEEIRRNRYVSQGKEYHVTNDSSSEGR